MQNKEFYYKNVPTAEANIKTNRIHENTQKFAKNN